MYTHRRTVCFRLYAGCEWVRKSTTTSRRQASGGSTPTRSQGVYSSKSLISCLLCAAWALVAYFRSCTLLHSGAVCCSLMQSVAVWCSVSRCVAVCRSVLQCIAVCCSVLQCVAVCCKCVAVCCNVLQCATVCCRVRQLVYTCT